MGLWDRIERWPLVRPLTIIYSPGPERREFEQAAQTQQQDGIEFSIAVLDAAQSESFFGVPMASRGVQPVWVRIVNRGRTRCRLHVVSIDPDYFSPLEAAAACHFTFARRLLGFGALGWLFLPLMLLAPLKLVGAWRANRKVDAFFRGQAFRFGRIRPGQTSEGFVFTPPDAGTKVVNARLLRLEGALEFAFNIPVAGIDADYEQRAFDELVDPGRVVECDLPALRERLAALPRAVTSENGSCEGDPLNLVVVGDFQMIRGAFGSRWDETETISASSCWKTFRAFLIGTEYRYSPISPLFHSGRSQDFALQRIRESINERLHLRLWLTELRHGGRTVWVGQVSRDIGVRFTLKTWNLTTHRIDPDVDESRDYVLEDLLEAERVERIGFVDGVGACDRDSPRRNLTGDPYFTDGCRALAILSKDKTTAQLLGRA